MPEPESDQDEINALLARLKKLAGHDFGKPSTEDPPVKNMPETLRVFSGAFGSRENACRYSEEQWEKPAPDDSWSDEAYRAWEDRNPTWLLRQVLTVEYLSPDFIETTHLKQRRGRYVD